MIDKFNDIWNLVPDFLQAVIIMSLVSIFWIFVLT